MTCSSRVCSRRLVVRKLWTLSASCPDESFSSARSIFWNTSRLRSGAIDIKKQILVPGEDHTVMQEVRYCRQQLRERSRLTDGSHDSGKSFPDFNTFVTSLCYG